jgi:hypothetical protein
VPFPLTPFQRGLLASDAYEFHAELLVAEADHVLRDISLVTDGDSSSRATWQESMDLSCAIGQIVLDRGMGDFTSRP